MVYEISGLAKTIPGAKLTLKAKDFTLIRHLSTDSRSLPSPVDTLFFAIKGVMHDGHDFIEAAHQAGVRNFVVDEKYHPEYEILPGNYIQTTSVLHALQDVVMFHRLQFSELISIGITGSNGKTTVKEWLGSLIHKQETVRSPKSYNSQTGVPLSVWQIEKKHEIGIFEAGISQVGEMSFLQAIIKPQIGIFTNIGDAHSSGFSSIEQKIFEKLILFKDASFLIYEEDDMLLAEVIQRKLPKIHKLSWGKNGGFLRVIKQEKKENKFLLTLEKDKIPFEIVLPFSDTASVQNFMHCLVLLLHLDYTIEEIQPFVDRLHNLPMRLEIKPGVNNGIIINDTYNADLQSFDLALEFLSQHAQEREKWVVLSPFDQTGKDDSQFTTIVANLLSDAGVKKALTLGKEYKDLATNLKSDLELHNFQDMVSLEEYLQNIEIDNKAILIKGSRRYGLEKLADSMAQKWHEAVLETDLLAVGHNLRYFSSWLKDNTGIIAVVKASAYGSGSHELAAYLEYARVDYLAVAYVDEGISLRKTGIVTPIMVLNSSSEQWAECAAWSLEPEIYSIEYMRKVWAVESHHNLKVHIKLDSGMNRLGLLPEDMEEAVRIISQWPDKITIASVFTHLASSEDENEDAFTHHQVDVYHKMYHALTEGLSYKPKKHVLNTAGIKRFPEYHFDYVRLGLGLYGIDVTRSFSSALEKVHSFKARIIQLKNVYQGHTVGYNRRWKIGMHGKVAVINAGYADGIMRMAGNERHSVWIKDDVFPIVGNVNMDLTIVYIGEREDIRVGDEVEIFGKNVPMEDLADACQTIPYEIISRISPRVRRLYFRG